ncbi:MAG: hypothetical protein VKJ09_09755 [Leptolyngbya sp.]|nr:hypothetical protein [Leptolyngbya sp.]
MDNLTTVTMINHNALAVATVLSSTLLSAPAIAQISQDAERANSFVDELITFIETDPVGRDVESVTLSSQPMFTNFDPNSVELGVVIEMRIDEPNNSSLDFLMDLIAVFMNGCLDREGTGASFHAKDVFINGEVEEDVRILVPTIIYRCSFM